MNHKISIKNLGPIKDIKDFEIKKFNMLIGKSGAGKSVLARAIFLFNHTFSDWDYIPGPLSTLPKAYDYIAELLREFFPQYDSYKIEYRYTKDFSVTVKKNRKISVKFSPKLVNRHRAMLEDVENLLRRKRTVFQSDEDYHAFMKEESKRIRWHENGPKIYGSFKGDLNLFRTIFIPAARSVVFDFDRSRLRLLNKVVSNDSLWDKIKVEETLLDKISEGDITLRLFSNDNMDSIENFQSLSKKYESIAKGKVHKRHGGQIVLTTKDGQTLSIDQLSSGQKGAIPILMLLQYIAEKNLQTLLIIEEPEAHLFPEDQSALLGKIVAVANETNSKAFITTHSPFLMMKTNNFIVAEEKNYGSLNKLFLPYDDIQACKMEDRKCESIKNERTGLISARYIDSVTDEIMREFDDIIGSKP